MPADIDNPFLTEWPSNQKAACSFRESYMFNAIVKELFFHIPETLKGAETLKFFQNFPFGKESAFRFACTHFFFNVAYAGFAGRLLLVA